MLSKLEVEPRAEDDAVEQEESGAPTDPGDSAGPSGSLDDDGDDDDDDDDEMLDEDDDVSDAESFTLRDKQAAINQTHPFGIRIWKPALYKKDRSVQRTAEGDIHSTPGGYVSNWLVFFNILWTLLFGWWLCLLCALPGIVCILLGFLPGSIAYGRVFLALGGYLFYPFGKYVKLLQEEAYAEEDEGEGRSISEYEQWQSGDIEEGRLFFGPLNRSLVGHRRNSVESLDETQSLLGRQNRGSPHREGTQRTKRRLFGRGKWSFGRVIFFLFFYGLITPALALVSGICWLLVFTIPMGKVTFLLFDHLRRHPLALSFHSDRPNTRRTGAAPSSILLCTYRAVGPRYWKYTVDGTNIILINLLSIVLFSIIDFFVLYEVLGIKSWITNPGLMFILGIFSIIPLAYFIGQAVASISAQSSMGVGATVNAFFSTVVEVFLYCVALKEGKAQLVEGAIIGSIFAGVLFLPGLSMCFGAFKRKTQRFNVKSAGVTTTMLLFAVIGAFSPTLFYQIYGSHELNCHACVHSRDPSDRDCRRCYFSQSPSLRDRFYLDAVRPYTYFSAILLFLSYVIGLIFTLRTHAAVIWNADADEKRAQRMETSTGQLASSVIHSAHPHGHDSGTFGTSSASDAALRTDIRDTQIYKRILGQSLKEAGVDSSKATSPKADKRILSPNSEATTPHMVPPKHRSEGDVTAAATGPEPNHNLADGNSHLLRQVAEVAATAAAAAATARDSIKHSRKPLHVSTSRPQATRTSTHGEAHEDEAGHGAEGGGHDAPNWSRTKSIIILLVATVAYAVIAEILVRTVDSVLESVTVDEKFLGFTLFALVPNTTEFLNAISFAMNGNIALSMEIGSAYALQVCLLQAPALVAFSAVHNNYVDPRQLSQYVFSKLDTFIMPASPANRC
jgi:Ca2+:H+ antiporter